MIADSLMGHFCGFWDHLLGTSGDSYANDGHVSPGWMFLNCLSSSQASGSPPLCWDHIASPGGPLGDCLARQSVPPMGLPSGFMEMCLFVLPLVEVEPDHRDLPALQYQGS